MAATYPLVGKWTSRTSNCKSSLRTLATFLARFTPRSLASCSPNAACVERKSDSRFGYCNRSIAVQLASLRTSLAGTVAEFRSNTTPMLLLGLQAHAAGASRRARDARRYLGKVGQQPFISKPRLDAVLDVSAGRPALASTLQTIGLAGIAAR